MAVDVERFDAVVDEARVVAPAPGTNEIRSPIR
jgi:hypothetical protein